MLATKVLNFGYWPNLSCARVYNYFFLQKLAQGLSNFRCMAGKMFFSFHTKIETLVTFELFKLRKAFRCASLPTSKLTEKRLVDDNNGGYG